MRDVFIILRPTNRDFTPLINRSKWDFPRRAGFLISRSRNPAARTTASLHLAFAHFAYVFFFPSPIIASVHLRASRSNCRFRSRSFIPRQRTSSPEERTRALRSFVDGTARFPRGFFTRDWNITQVVSITAGEVTWIKENSIAFTDEHGRRPTFSPAETVKWRMAVIRAATLILVARSYLGWLSRNRRVRYRSATRIGVGLCRCT